MKKSLSATMILTASAVGLCVILTALFNWATGLKLDQRITIIFLGMMFLVYGSIKKIKGFNKRNGKIKRVEKSSE